MTVILCYGDSNTHGTRPMAQIGVSNRHDRLDRWPEALGQALGPDHFVLSEGLPGRTTVHEDDVEGGVRNGAAVLPAILHSHKPIGLLIVMLGTNDLKPAFGVGAFEIARSVERVVQVARREDVHLRELIVCPPPVRPAGCLQEVFAGAEARQRGLAGYLAEAADRLGCGFLDAGAHIAVSPTDGVHWEAAAHRELGGNVMADAVHAILS